MASSPQKRFLREKFCPRQRSCPRQVVSSKKRSAKSSAPGSEVARDKLLLIKKVDFWKKVLPQAAKLPGTSGFFQKKSFFEKKICPRQRSCPGQGACPKKNTFFKKKFCRRQRSCPGQVASSKKVRFLRGTSAPGSEAARDKWFLQKKSDF